MEAQAHLIDNTDTNNLFFIFIFHLDCKKKKDLFDQVKSRKNWWPTNWQFIHLQLYRQSVEKKLIFLPKRNFCVVLLTFIHIENLKSRRFFFPPKLNLCWSTFLFIFVWFLYWKQSKSLISLQRVWCLFIILITLKKGGSKHCYPFQGVTVIHGFSYSLWKTSLIDTFTLRFEIESKLIWN